MKVLEAMGFGQRFRDWIRMLHDGVTTRFILNFLTRPVEVLISIRQGDPAAMCQGVGDPGGFLQQEAEAR